MKFTLIALFILALYLAPAHSYSQAAKQGKAATYTKDPGHPHRIVIQMSTADSLEQKALLQNIRNIQQIWGDSVMIEVVIFGPGISLALKDQSTQAAALHQLSQKNTRFVVCRNTMKQKNVKEEDVLPGLGFVPSGAVEVILKQEQGWSYFKAGF